MSKKELTDEEGHANHFGSRHVWSTAGTAVNDFDRVMAAKNCGAFDHVAVAVITKGADGQVEIERHDSTAKHLAWGGALIGGAMFVVAPPLAPTALGLGGGASAAGLAGAGGIAGHFWHNIPKDTLREMSDTLEAGDSGLVIVAVNPKGSDLTDLLSGAQKVVDRRDDQGRSRGRLRRRDRAGRRLTPNPGR